MSESKTSWFTFGCGQNYPDGFVILRDPEPGSGLTARDVLHAATARRWSMEYDSADQAGVERFGLVRVDLCSACGLLDSMPWAHPSDVVETPLCECDRMVRDRFLRTWITAQGERLSIPRNALGSSVMLALLVEINGAALAERRIRFEGEGFARFADRCGLGTAYFSLGLGVLESLRLAVVTIDSAIDVRLTLPAGDCADSYRTVAPKRAGIIDPEFILECES